MILWFDRRLYLATGGAALSVWGVTFHVVGALPPVPGLIARCSMTSSEVSYQYIATWKTLSKQAQRSRTSSVACVDCLVRGTLTASRTFGLLPHLVAV